MILQPIADNVVLKIKDRERITIEKRYLEGLNQSEIADYLGVSQAQVSRIESSALKTLKRLVK